MAADGESAPEAVQRAAQWARLRHDLDRLAAASPRVLQQWPGSDSGYQRPPVQVTLESYASDTAEELHSRYGDFVALRVGALPYPPTNEPPRPRTETLAPIDPAELHIALESPLTVRSGHTAHHGVLVTNLGDHDLAVRTNGGLTASVVDASGAVIGGFAGWEASPLCIFTVRPSSTVRIPLVVGTASYVPELGYTVPPGTWHLTVPIGRTMVSPPLEFTVTP